MVMMEKILWIQSILVLKDRSVLQYGLVFGTSNCAISINPS